MPELYYNPADPFCQRALLALRYAGLEFRHLLLSSADELPAELRGADLPQLLVEGEAVGNSLEIMDWALDQMDKPAWIDWDLDEMDDSLYLIELCDGPFHEFTEIYCRTENTTERVQAGEAAAGFLQQLGGLLQNSAFLLRDEPMLIDFALLPFVHRFVAAEPEHWARQLPPQILQWLKQMRAQSVCKGLLD